MANTCYIQDTCPYYSANGSRRTHHTRVMIPCEKMLDNSCEMDINIRLFYGEVIACDLEKMRRLKGQLK